MQKAKQMNRQKNIKQVLSRYLFLIKSLFIEIDIKTAHDPNKEDNKSGKKVS